VCPKQSKTTNKNKIKRNNCANKLNGFTSFKDLLSLQNAINLWIILCSFCYLVFGLIITIAYFLCVINLIIIYGKKWSFIKPFRMLESHNPYNGSGMRFENKGAYNTHTNAGISYSAVRFQGKVLCWLMCVQIYIGSVVAVKHASYL
jgi:hypothetical protein